MQPQFPPTPTSQRKRIAHRAKDLKGARIAVTEIYESEKSYVRSLRVLVEDVLEFQNIVKTVMRLLIVK
jgi:hypothetical protein